MSIHFFISTALFAASQSIAHTITLSRKPIDTTHEELTLDIHLDKGQILSKSVTFSTNSPLMTITSHRIEPEPVYFFDTSTKENKLGYKGHVRAFIELETQTLPEHQVDLFMHYMLNNKQGPQEKRFVLLRPALHEPRMLSDTATPATSAQTETHTTGRMLSTLSHKITDAVRAAKHSISTLFTNTESRTMQFLLAFLLGVLMSFTPCIYPMIPITVGILGTGAHNTVARNFLLALSYTVGLATTFAVMGLLVTSCGAQCGQILSNPLFVIILVIILGYLGLSMLGLYEMKIPRFLQPKNRTVTRGSFLSAFIFGIASGTIASPCMSPGLALVLTATAKLGSMLLGFGLLFVFGVGSALPLLIIGTFSASLALLPRAGIWMVEVKKIFGFLLLGMCVYYVSNILPLVVATGLTALFLCAVGGYYIFYAWHARSTTGRLFAGIIALSLATAALYTAYTAYKQSTTVTTWRTDYETARQEALRDKKYLLLDFGASWCSLCHVLEKGILSSPEITQLDAIIPVKIDGSTQGSEPYSTLVKQHTIRGLPTVLLIDPVTDTVMARWGSELSEQSAADFKEEIIHGSIRSRT